MCGAFFLKPLPILWLLALSTSYSKLVSADKLESRLPTAAQRRPMSAIEMKKPGSGSTEEGTSTRKYATAVQNRAFLKESLIEAEGREDESEQAGASFPSGAEGQEGEAPPPVGAPPPMGAYQQPMGAPPATGAYQQPMGAPPPMGAYQQPMGPYQQPMGPYQQPMGAPQPMGAYQPTMGAFPAMGVPQPPAGYAYYPTGP